MTGSPQRAPDCVFTLPALESCLEHAEPDWYATLTVPPDGTWNVLSTDLAGARYFIHRTDTPDVPRIVIFGQDGALFSPAARSAYDTLFERIARVAREALHPPVVLPETWNPYRHQNRLAFFAGLREDGALRWVAELNPLESADVCFWKITTPGQPVALDNYAPPYNRYTDLTTAWPQAFEQVHQHFAALPIPPETETIQPTVDLEATTFGAVTQHRTYSVWLKYLTPHQREFLDADPSHAIKLRGPAGSGKTLALELKALRELQRAREQGVEIRILFATHSWTVAEQVDAALRGLSELDDISGIEVYPLLSMAQAVLPAERAGHGFELLGEDSLSGKRAQIDRIARLVAAAKTSDWLAFRSRVSDGFAARVEAESDSLDNAAFVWDLIGEFSSVLSANGILPGVNAERQYLALRRSPWMMPLANEAELQFVLLLYTRYVNDLRRDGLLGSDQLINDFLNYLETFAWNIRRARDGYDLIFVDELHLFSEQERLVLHYLTRSPDQYPQMFMALDPRQSPAEIYAGVPADSVSRGESGTADAFLGEVRWFELDEVHRFTPEILALVRHINQSFPALELGPDWELDLSRVESSARDGEKPSLVTHGTRAEERTGAIQAGLTAAREAGLDDRAALILIEPLLLDAFVASVEASRPGSATVIASRDDVERLRYARRSLVLGPAEFLAGLQFESVVIAGLPVAAPSLANLGHRRRRLLSLLYLAISRASSRVEIHVSEDAGGIPPILESAVGANVLAVDNGLRGPISA